MATITELPLSDEEEEDAEEKRKETPGREWEEDMDPYSKMIHDFMVSSLKDQEAKKNHPKEAGVMHQFMQPPSIFPTGIQSPSMWQQQQQQIHQQQDEGVAKEYKVATFEGAVSFKEVYDAVCDRIRTTGLLENVMSDFQALTTDKERVEYARKLPELKNLKLDESFSRKSREDAANYEKVYDALISTDTSAQKAIKLMEKCIAKTPLEDTEALAVRHMKRGWAFLLLERFDEAYRDAQVSMSLECPEELIWNSYEICGYCSARKQKNKDAEMYFTKALENLRKSSVSNEVKASATGRIMTVFRNVKSKKNRKQKEKKKIVPTIPETPAIPKVAYGLHTQLKSASEAIDCVISKEKGCTLVANRDIRPGEVLIVDSPYVSVLSPEHYDSHCLHCFRRLPPQPLPCSTCAKVSYCSESCRDASWTSLHYTECRVLNLLDDATLGKMGLLTYRILTKTGLAFLQRKKTLLLDLLDQEGMKNTTASVEERMEKGEEEEERQVPSQLEWDGPYCSEDYHTVFRQVAHSSKRSFGDLFKRTLSAIYIGLCLQVSGFLSHESSEEDLLYLSCLALRHLQSCSCNAYEVCETVMGPGGVRTAQTVELGGAVYPTIALTNHGCAPNAARYSLGDCCVLRALRSIPAGGEVLDNYGFFFHTDGLMERQQKLLSQYKFLCECTPCTLEWPLYPHSQGESFMFCCPNEMCMRPCAFSDGLRAECAMCGNKQQFIKLIRDVKRHVDTHRVALSKLVQGEVLPALRLLLENQGFFDRVAALPVRYYTDAQEAIRQCFNFLGNVHHEAS
ncbi:protein-lysine N-methyltransferase SMYD4-like [Oratosquilla oratoria]|uniref:protein-lysine N-methyltransferase SMYD4-like n=1 Tax=Oratosquilla oratoria TaxID=337810 RepID=UPI003F777EF8